MRYDDKLIELVGLPVENNFTGEYDLSWQESGIIIDACVAPLSAEIQMREYGFITEKVKKVITRDIVSENNRYKFEDEIYVVKQVKRHKHRRNFMLLEVVK